MLMLASLLLLFLCVGQSMFPIRSPDMGSFFGSPKP